MEEVVVGSLLYKGVVVWSRRARRPTSLSAGGEGGRSQASSGSFPVLTSIQP